ncbi:MAG: ABC transporter ATP-binding protein [Anaerolineales bacterium]|nr:MAG: ABC transporter ATP-binding protein [Anaerolineales bacterium]
MISLRNVSKVYTVSKEVTVTAVHDTNLEVTKGEFVIVTGRSGSGKTTMLNMIGGLTDPTSGEVYLGDVEVWKLPDQEKSLLRNQKIGFIFQFPSLLPTLTTLENVMLPAMFGPENDKVAVGNHAAYLLEQIGLADKMKAFPRQLSGGQQQRVVIARALINSPEVLLADEPTSDLDEQTEHEIMALFQEIHAKTGVTALLVTHSTGLGHYGTRSIQMVGGEIVEAAA